MRGSDHDKAVREYTIKDDGMQIGEPFPEGVLVTVPHML